MIFNKRDPIVTAILDVDFDRFYTPKQYRLARLEQVFSEAPFELQILLMGAPLIGTYKRVLVDIKVQTLNTETYSCIKGWHLDGKLTTNNPDKNTYHICTFGGAPTEFLGCPLILPNEPNQKKLKRFIPDNIPVYKLPQYVWNTYGEHDWHRGTNSETPLVRTFIRLCETNYLRPQRN